MTIQLTQEELDFITENRAAGFTIDEEYNFSSLNEDEGLYEQILSTGRKILAVHHYNPDTLTMYEILEAPVPEPMEKLATFLNANPDVRELLGL